MTSELENEKLTRSLMEHIILGVAHEINNPNSFVRLNAMTIKKMIGMIGRCLDEYEEHHPDEKFGPYTLTELRSKMVLLTDSILQASVRIIAVADKLKQCSSFAMAKASHISVSTLVQNVLDMHRFLLEKWARLELVFDKDKNYDIDGFGLQLEQAFSILLTNACDAISERYPDPDKRQGLIHVEILEEKDTVVVRFVDNGTGMDQETLAKIFTPYFTTKPQGVGDGLGLPLCLSIIDRHGGKLDVESTKGIGTTLTVRLPKNS